ncbi:putative thiamine biosynthesis protein ThiC [Candidatus Zinderia insecticola CARI]|uniref:Putative thiamine biosynthesis protein ThiC n=1 Tax=Zinderia insecticola (strain CARI) TaxID=871271 RepID=E0TJ20_ZINIC|nr:putative thiamine biosynthesis protein ThiC [Candidatus Zinderia insecticola CARI]
MFLINNDIFYFKKKIKKISKNFSYIKRYIKGNLYNINVPIIKILNYNLKNYIPYIYNSLLYYIKNDYNINFNLGLPPLLKNWILNRKNINYKKNITQIYYAKLGIISCEMEYISIKENIYKKKYIKYLNLLKIINIKKNFTNKKILIKNPEYIRKKIYKGLAIIPCNINHNQIQPIIIGKNFLFKINFNIQNYNINYNIFKKLEKLIISIKLNNNLIIFLYFNKNIKKIRNLIIKNNHIPIVTIPIYETLEKCNWKIKKINWKIFKKIILKQSINGIDCFIFYFGLTLKYIPYFIKKYNNNISREGSIILKWCFINNKEFFLFKKFKNICKIIKKYNVSLILGNIFKKNNFYNLNKLKYLELKKIFKLIKISWKYNIQTIIEKTKNIYLKKKIYNKFYFHKLNLLVINIFNYNYNINYSILFYYKYLLNYFNINKYLKLWNIKNINNNLFLNNFYNYKYNFKINKKFNIFYNFSIFKLNFLFK